MSKVQQRDPANLVHQNAILCETTAKELKLQKLYTNFSVNPFKKTHIIAGKPNSFHDTEEGEEDIHFREVIKRAHQGPVEKYTEPQTEAQEIGWMTKPLIDMDRTDRRLHHPRTNSAITKYMDAAWKTKEQTQNLN